jgi:hypothetical protein
MKEIILLVIVLAGIAGVVVLFRFVGAWMFRIDELIENQKISIRQTKELIETIKRGA